MMARNQITLEPELQKRAQQRSHDLGISFAEYIRRLVARDIGKQQPSSNPSLIFDLGSSGGSDIAANKDRMFAEAIAASHRKSRRKPSHK
jgi:hypothetical protein